MSATATPTGRREQPPIQLPGLLSLVAKRAHYAGAEPVYRRYRGRQHGAPILRWAGTEPAVRPSAAFLAEARIAAFWPYREGVLEVADAFDMTRAEWASAYLRALAAWAVDDRPLAACVPAGPPLCVPEDMAVIAGVHAPWAAGPSAAEHAERLSALAGDVVRSVLSDAGITPLGAFNTVRDEVRSLLSPPPESLAEQILRAVAELIDRMIHGSSMAPEQARRLQGMLGSLATLLAKQSGSQQDGGAGDSMLLQAEISPDEERSRLASQMLTEVTAVRAARDRLSGITAPNATMSRRHEARALLLLGEPEQARQALELALACEAAHNGTHESRTMADTHQLLARVHRDLGRPGKALEHAREASRIFDLHDPDGRGAKLTRRLIAELAKGQ